MATIIDVYYALSVQYVEQVVAISVVVFGGGVAWMVGDTVGAYSRRPDGYILGDQIQSVQLEPVPVLSPATEPPRSRVE